MSDAVESIFGSIIADRGASNFDATQLQIARRVAQMLADDGDLSATALNALMGLLPEKKAGPEYDLSKLTDAEFATLDKLTAIAAGIAPSKPEKPRQRPRRSYRQLYVEETVILFDQLAAQCAEARRAGNREYRLDMTTCGLRAMPCSPFWSTSMGFRCRFFVRRWRAWRRCWPSGGYRYRLSRPLRHRLRFLLRLNLSRSRRTWCSRCGELSLGRVRLVLGRARRGSASISLGGSGDRQSTSIACSYRSADQDADCGAHCSGGVRHAGVGAQWLASPGELPERHAP
jgi:hypothetical protein